MIEKLQRIGMTKSEAIVFELLVKYGRISGSQLSKKSGIDRSTTYNLLESLNKKGFVSYTIKEGLKLYQISDPSNLNKFAEEVKQMTDSIIEEISETKPKVPLSGVVEVYEGANAPRIMYRTFAQKNNQTFYTYGGYGKMFTKLQPEIEDYIKEFKSKKDFLYSFISKDYSNIDNLSKLPGKIKKTNLKSLPAGFTVGSEMVAFHIYEDESQVIMIKHPLIAKAMKELFELAWGKESAKEIKI